VNHFDIRKLSLVDDKAQRAFLLAQEGHTLGVFQLDSSLGQKWCRLIKPNSIRDLALISAIIRPGPLDSGLSDEYLSKREMNDKSAMHPKLENVLDENYGVWIYQEDLIKAVQGLTGWDLQQSELLRYAFSKKKADKMAALEEQFIKDCVKNNITKKDAEFIFAMIKKSERYLFNRAHATLYAPHSFIGLYTKANYPL